MCKGLRSSYVGRCRERIRLKRLIERDGSLCVWCSKELTADHTDASIDHALPRVRGGSHRSENLILSCAHCNTSRHDRDLLTWMRICEERGLKVQRSLVKAAHRRVLRSPRARRQNPVIQTA